MFYFTTIENTSRNYTPAALIYEYAKKHFYKTFYYYDSLRISIAGIVYKYDHWNITKHENSTETVKIYLKRVKKGE